MRWPSSLATQWRGVIYNKLLFILSYQRAFENVEFMQANLANMTTCERVFQDDNGGGFDYVFHLAAETKYGQTNEVRIIIFTSYYCFKTNDNNNYYSVSIYHNSCLNSITSQLLMLTN